MVGEIYFTSIAYSNFQKLKGRPILLIKELENDYLFLPLTSNLSRKGIVLTNKDLSEGILKKDSVVVIPKISAIDKEIIKTTAKFLAKIKDKKFLEIINCICHELECYSLTNQKRNNNATNK